MAPDSHRRHGRACPDHLPRSTTDNGADARHKAGHNDSLRLLSGARRFRVDKPAGRTHFRRLARNHMTKQSGKIRAGMGGWTFEPWEGTFYPGQAAQEEAARIRLAAGADHRGQRHLLFRLQARPTPTPSGTPRRRTISSSPSRATASSPTARCWPRRQESGSSSRQGWRSLVPSSGPIVWQFAPTKKFEPDDFEGFLKLLPDDAARPVAAPRARSAQPVLRGAGIRRAGEEIQGGDLLRASPRLSGFADVTGGLRLCAAAEGRGRIPPLHARTISTDGRSGRNSGPRAASPTTCRYADPSPKPEKKPRDVFVYIIHEGKLRAPQGAMAFMERV
jgi:hypothetical protein